MALGETARLMSSLELKDNFSKGVASAEKSLGRFESRLGKVGGHVTRGIGNATKNLERFAVVGVGGAAAALGYAVKAAIDWESAVAGINKTVDATPEQLKAITDGLTAMSNRMPVAANDLAAIAEQAGALGIARDDILAFTETVALIGTTTDVSTDQAATALGQLGNVLKLTGQDYDNFASALVDLGNKGASTESQILEITRRSGAAANLIGLATEETLGWASAAANLGINQELAGTSLQNLYLKAMPAFTQGSKTLQKITGQTGAQLKRSFEKDASGALQNFLADLGKMPQDQRLKAVQKLFGKGSGLTRLVLGLADSVDSNLTPSLNTATEAWETNTAAAEEAEKRYRTTQSSLTVLRNNIKNAAVTIGTALLPSIGDFARKVADTIKTLGERGEIQRFGENLARGFDNVLPTITRILDRIAKVDLGKLGTNISNAFDEVLRVAKQVPWSAIGDGLKMGAEWAKRLFDVFKGLPPEVQSTIIALAGLNKLTGGAVTGIVGELAKGLIKGVLGITAGVVNITAAKVVGGPGSPGGPGGSPSTKPTTRPSTTRPTGIRVDGGRIAGTAGAGIAVNIDELIGIQKDAKQRLIDNVNASELTAARVRELRAQGLDIESTMKTELSSVYTGVKNASAQNIAHINRVVGAERTGTSQTIAHINKVATGVSGVRVSQQATNRNLDQVESAIRNKKFSVKVTQRQTQSVQARIAAAAASSGGKSGFHYTKSQGQDLTRFLAAGAVGLATRPTPAVFGEAGNEAFAILRNPRSGVLGASAPPIVNVTVNIDPRRVTKKQTSSGIYKTFVST